MDGVISGRSTRVFPSRSKNLYKSLDGVVPISRPKISKIQRLVSEPDDSHTDAAFYVSYPEGLISFHILRYKCPEHPPVYVIIVSSYNIPILSGGKASYMQYALFHEHFSVLICYHATK